MLIKWGLPLYPATLPRDSQVKPQSESAKSVKKEAKPNSLVTALEAIQSDLTLLKQAFDKAHTSSERTANEKDMDQLTSHSLDVASVLHVTQPV